MATTNTADLVLRCLACGHTRPMPTVEIEWPEHCGYDMRLTNLTDRDGNPADRGEP